MSPFLTGAPSLNGIRTISPITCEEMLTVTFAVTSGTATLNPVSAVTAADGTFEIAGVPPGKHKLKIWERFAKPKFQEVTVDVPAGGVARLSHPITEAIEADPPHKNKFGTEYPANYK